MPRMSKNFHLNFVSGAFFLLGPIVVLDHYDHVHQIKTGGTLKSSSDHYGGQTQRNGLVCEACLRTF